MKNIRIFYLEIFPFLVVLFSIYLNRRVFVMSYYILRPVRRFVETNHYENTPIQIYRKFHLQKLKKFQIKKT